MARLLFLILDPEKPSSKKRVLCSLDYLRSRGHRVEVLPIPLSFYSRILLCNALRRYDLVILQKKLFKCWQFSLLRWANRNLVFDFDDAVMFHELERGEPVTGRFFARFAHTVGNCRGVIAGNSYLAEFASAAQKKNRQMEPHVLVLPTPVDTGVLFPRTYPTDQSRVTIGWLGTKGNLVHLRIIQGALKRVLQDNPNALFKVVSNAKPDGHDISNVFEPWNQKGEDEALRSFDIGVMPLEDNLWTRGKGGYKLLQYMAAGSASVASPVGINCEIINHGENGFLANSEKEWAEALGSLVGDCELRKRIGIRARETVEQEYSLENYNKCLGTFLEDCL